MIKILQARLQHCVNQELPDVQPEFTKGRRTRDHIASFRWIIDKAREYQKNIYICFIDYAKAFDCVDHNKLWKTLKEMGIPDHLICLLWNLYVGQEATVSSCMEQLPGSRLRKESDNAVYCHSVYLTYMQSTWSEMPVWISYKLESRLWISTTSDNADDTILMAESEEDLKRLLMRRVKKSA